MCWRLIFPGTRMHASHAIHFAFLCILSLLHISLHVSPPTIVALLSFLTCLLLFLAWLHAFLDQSTLRMDVLPRITLLDSDHVPECIAWRWHLFQS
jgi:hypothetical protein